MGLWPPDPEHSACQLLVQRRRRPSGIRRAGQGNKLEQVPVRVGPFGENSVPVLEGLKAEDWIVAAGVHVLHPGQEVRPIDRANRAINVAAKE